MTASITNRRIWAIVLIISLGWGTSPIAIRVGLLEGLGPLTMAAGSSFVAAVSVAIMIVALRRGTLIGPRELRIGAVLAVLSVLLPYQTRNLALVNASAGFIALLSALIPLVTAVMAHFILADERLNLAMLAGLLLGLGGVMVLVLGGDSGIAEGGKPLLAGMFGLASVVSVSLAAVYAKRFAGTYSVLGVTAVQLVMGSVALWILALTFEGVPSETTTAGVLSLLYSGSMGSFVPLALYYFLIRHVTVTYSSVVGYVVPFVAVFAGVRILDERLQPGILVGGVLVLSGVVVTDLVRIRESRRRTFR